MFVTTDFRFYPNRNYANYVYNSMGYVDETFGMSKTAVRLTALLADAAYTQLSAEQITDVQYYVKCAGGNYANINIHALTENSTWAENTVTWNNIGAHSETVYATESVGGNAWDSFDITNLVKEWKNGTQNPQCGLVMVSESTTIRTSTLSSEYSNADYKPYVVFTYNNAVTINQTAAEVYKGDTITLTATTIPSGQSVTWASEDSTIATVDQNGVVTGVGVGETTITATLEDGIWAECNITVFSKNIMLNFTSVEVNKGSTVHLVAETIPQGEPVEWSSSDTAVATVSNGVVTGITEGQTEITARVDADTYAVCTVYVIGYFALSCTTTEVDENQTVPLGTVNVPSHQTVTWYSSNTTAATVDSQGMVLGQRAGLVTITARLSDGTEDSCDVYVTVPDGVYRIKSQYVGNRYLGVDGPESAYSSTLELQLINSSGMDYLGQLWRIEYLDEGRYLICPMSRTSRYLRETNDYVYLGNTSEHEFGSLTAEDFIYIFYDVTGYVMQGGGTTVKVFAPTSTTDDADIGMITYNTSSLQCRWTLELEKGVFVCNENGTGIPRNYEMYLELGTTDTLGYTIVSGTGNLDQECRWSARYPDTVPNPIFGTEIWGMERGVNSYYVSTEIEGVEYRFPFAVICRETISVKNYYDSTVDTNIINLIDEAVAFLNDVYNDEFYLYFEMDGIPQSYSQAGVDICPHGGTASCSIYGNGCSTNCAQHHKNVERIAKEAFANLWEPNTVVVLWSDVEYSGYFCYGDDHEPVLADALVTPYNTGEYTNYLPVIQVLRSMDEAHMAVNLAHEIAHTLGLQEVRDDFYGNDNGKHSDEDHVRCIMAWLGSDDIDDIYENGVEMCPDCIDKLHEEIADDAYESGLYTQNCEGGA